VGKRVSSVIVETPGIVFADGDGFVAGSPMLDIYSQGDTEEEAIEMVKDAIASMLEHWAENGGLEEMLREHGLTSVAEGKSQRWTAPDGSMLIPDELAKWGYDTFKVIQLTVGPIAASTPALTEN
jgi:predicted RNase H-like HicB family nuclease